MKRDWKKSYYKLKEDFERWKSESVKWSVEDFTSMEVNGWSITEEQAQEALEDMINHHDAGIGIHWQTVEYYLMEHGTQVEEGSELWRSNI